MIQKVLQHKALQEKPPVLIDIGASGKIHRIWRKIAKNAVCIAFDADDRDFGYVTDESGKYKKLHIYNCIVSDKKSEKTDFYLTKSPHCSSILKPDLEGVKDYAFAKLFEIDKIVQLKTIDLPSVFEELKIDYVDWFKTDSQGTDLRLFQSMGEKLISKVICAEFEPGILNAYQGEDKMHQILKFMETGNQFWLANLIIKGAPKISPEALNSVFSNTRIAKLGMFSLKKAAGWGEMTYLNNLNENDGFGLRDYLLTWVFATVQLHHGFALMLAQKAQKLFNDPILKKMEIHSKSQMRWNILKIRFFPAIITKLRLVFGLD